MSISQSRNSRVIISKETVLDFVVPECRKKSKTESSFKCTTDHAYEGEGMRCGESIDKFADEVSSEATLHLDNTKHCVLPHIPACWSV